MARKPDVALMKVAAGKQTVRGFLDRMDDAVISGWAVDSADPMTPLRLRVLVDDVIVDIIACDVRRPDAGAFNLPNDEVGFSYSIPRRFLDGGRHVLRFTTIDGSRLSMSSRTGMEMPELHFSLAQQTHVEGVLDGVVDGLVQGWALNVDTRSKTRTGGLRILVTCGGQPVAELLADQFRADVAEALNADAACGFTFSPPAELRQGRRMTLQFYAMPGKLELRGSPLELGFPDDSERERISSLITRAEELFGYAYHLRQELKAALPHERYMLSDYPRWAKASLPLAPARARAMYGEMPADVPLVSIICPVFRPAYGDFLAAVDSVRAQSYENWELLLVDDASGDAELTDMIRRLAAADARIRPTTLQQNGGISAASNVALRLAKGRFVAFFDHDDALEPAALEIMLRAQAATGARMLYSDEDKVDRSGALSEPHFKPDFNYRLLLELNYICHFVMIEADLVREIGGLNSEFDGAQDHDFLLRASEVLTPGEIFHVPEVVYHWRKSASSTASAIGVKPLAAGAGERAVLAHLKRRKLAASVTRRGQLTCYRVQWKPPARALRAAGVSILIPFRDHIDLTAACVAAVRTFSGNVKYEIILLDNWSNTLEAEGFCVAEANMPDTTVLRVAEPFNYSRLNNIGARAAKHEFLLLLNNDVFVQDPMWLRRMVEEMLVDERLAAVGPKLLYPNGTIQHAGVVLGVGGIADHAFRGNPGTAPGYMMHAMTTQEVSAITGACMLVRRAAFEAVGGLDETELPIAFNDIDLCMKLTQAGWRIVFTPDVVAEHRESISRGDDFNEAKIARFMLENEVMRQRYGERLPYDPFYNRHFSRDGGVYRELRMLGPGDPLAAGQAAGGK